MRDDEVNSLHFLTYFLSGIIYGTVVGLLNMEIERCGKQNPRWKQFINKLELQRKSVHIQSWFPFFFLHDLLPIRQSTRTQGIYMAVAAAFLTVLNILRIYTKSVKIWVQENWKGFLKNEDDHWPASLSLFFSISQINFSIGSRAIVQLAIAQCTTGNTVSFFMHNLWPENFQIRKGKTLLSFLAAGFMTSIHSWGYLYFSGHIITDLYASLIVLIVGFQIGGLTDLLPSKEIHLHDNFTGMVMSGYSWLQFFRMNPQIVDGMSEQGLSM